MPAYITVAGKTSPRASGTAGDGVRDEGEESDGQGKEAAGDGIHGKGESNGRGAEAHDQGGREDAEKNVDEEARRRRITERDGGKPHPSTTPKGAAYTYTYIHVTPPGYNTEGGDGPTREVASGTHGWGPGAVACSGTVCPVLIITHTHRAHLVLW